MLLAPPFQRLRLTQGGIEAIRVPVIPVIRTDPNGQIWLRWNKEFETVLYVAEDDFSILEGKTVIVGVTAEGLVAGHCYTQGPSIITWPAAITLQTVIDGDSTCAVHWAFPAELLATGI